MRPIRLVLLVTLLTGASGPMAHGQTQTPSPTIDTVRFEGLERTRPDFLRQFLSVRPGQPYDSAQVAADVQVLRNAGVLGAPSADLQTPQPGRHVLVFRVTEYATRLPYVTLGGLSSNVWFQVGGVDTNWLGRSYDLGAYYRYDDRHSFGLHQSMPYLFGGRWGLSYSLDRLATREPAFFGDETVSYDVTRLSGIGLVRYELLKTPGAGLTSFVEVGGGLLHEVYQKSAPASSPGPADDAFWKYVLKAHLTQRDLDHHRHERVGFENVTKLQTVKTKDRPFNFWKVLNIFRGYLRPYDGANWAARLRTGLSTNERSPFIPFVLDSYVNVRGVGNTVARGTAELTVNLEHRQTLAEGDHLILQGVAFSDVSGWRPGGASLTDLFVADNIVSFGGLGLRLNLRYRYNITFRADYGLNLFDPAQRGTVIGIGQYF